MSEQDAVAVVLPSVVRIQAGNSVGTGLLLKESDDAGARPIVITNAHVVGTARVALVQFQSSQQVQGTVERVDPTADLALLRLNDSSGTPATLADVAELQLGEPLLAIGYALDLRGGPSVTRGVFSARRMSDYGTDYIQTDTPINSGNSGGPLISLRGQVVGLNTFRFEGSGGRPVQGVGFAVSSTTIRSFLLLVPPPVATPTVSAKPIGVDPVNTVRAFYDSVNGRSFPQAWALLSKGFRGTNTYDNWVKGYSTTVFVYVIDLNLVSQDSATAVVAVTVAAADVQNGRYVTHTYGGTWKEVIEAGSWRLDFGNIIVVQ